MLSPTTTNKINIPIIGISLTAAASIILTTLYHRIKLKSNTEKLVEQRLAERRGRIRAEVKLRNALKQQQQQQEQTNQNRIENNGKNNDGDDNGSSDVFKMRRIGVMITPYPKRMGTPRQAQLVPHSRAFVRMSVPMATVAGIQDYSHCWIIFAFHANTDLPGSGKTKIRPPRAGGLKVGQMATRSPHRPNPIGLSLVRIVGVDEKEKRVMVEGVDLVNGTPVYDIKPCVPWDIPGHFDKSTLRVPHWVDQNDTLREVTFAPAALRSLRENYAKGHLSPLYEPAGGTNGEDFERGLDSAVRTVKEILAQDPRASARRGSSQKDPYRCLFCGVQLEFVVDAEVGVVEVVGVGAFDLGSLGSVDGVPIATEGIVAIDEGEFVGR